MIKYKLYLLLFLLCSCSSVSYIASNSPELIVNQAIQDVPEEIDSVKNDLIKSAFNEFQISNYLEEKRTYFIDSIYFFEYVFKPADVDGLGELTFCISIADDGKVKSGIPSIKRFNSQKPIGRREAVSIFGSNNFENVIFDIYSLNNTAYFVWEILYYNEETSCKEKMYINAIDSQTLLKVSIKGIQDL